MISVSTNIGEVAARLINRLATIERTKDQMIRSICTSLVPMIKERVHERGEYNDGSKFGGYTPAYLKIRERYNRNEGNKKVFSLTRKLEGALTVVPNGESYAVGIIDLQEEQPKTVKRKEVPKMKPRKSLKPKSTKPKKLYTTSQIAGFIQEKYDSEDGTRRVYGVSNAEREEIQAQAAKFIQDLP